MKGYGCLGQHMVDWYCFQWNPTAWGYYKIKTVRSIRHQTFFVITIECCYQSLMCVITHSGIYSGHLLQHDLCCVRFFILMMHLQCNRNFLWSIQADIIYKKDSYFWCKVIYFWCTYFWWVKQKRWRLLQL